MDRVTDAMLQAAVSQAVREKLVPAAGFAGNVAENWERIRRVVQAALDAAQEED
jgi:hypothetical protein